MPRRSKLSVIERMILEILQDQGGIGACGVRIRSQLENGTQVSLHRKCIVITSALHRLRQKKMVRSWWGTWSIGTGRYVPRHYHCITARGRRAIHNSSPVLAAMRRLLPPDWS